MSRSSARARSAFTLVELLVVIAIIGVLVALLLPAVQAAREAANRSSCSNKLKQLAIGVHNFHDTKKMLPRGAENAVYPQPNPPGNTTSFMGTNWLVYVLPFIEQQALYDQYDFTVSYADAANDDVGNTVVDTLFCPSGPRPQVYKDPNAAPVNGDTSTHYYGVMGPGGDADPTTLVQGTTTYSWRVGNPNTNGCFAFHGCFTQYRDTTGSVTTKYEIGLADLIDGTSNTLMIGERSCHHKPPASNPGLGHSFRSWIRGNNGGSAATKNVKFPINAVHYNGTDNFNDMSFASNHPGGCQFALGDASVRFVGETFNMDLYKCASSINSGENAQIP